MTIFRLSMYARIDLTRAGCAIRISTPARRRTCEWNCEGLKRRPLTTFCVIDQRAVNDVNDVKHF
jgi:hypothetical protein